MEGKDTRDLEHECKKFRICIIGRSGVGKSTLLGKVFGFSDDEVSSAILLQLVF
jgi:ABC-type nitrate/sulfonate/bicarbonate transport system ATPase subunit